MSGDVRDFYGQWARLYEVVARWAPGVGSLRATAAEALELSPGDTVVDVGCGTGATLPYLRERVGSEGTVLGIDVTRRMLDRATRMIEREGWSNVHLIEGDGATPPLSAGSVDAVVATFVVGMFDDPAHVVDNWCDLLEPGGRIALLNAARSERLAGAPVNLALDALTVLSTPPTRKVRYERDLTGALTERVESSAATIRRRSDATAERRFMVGLVRLTSGRVAE